MKILVGYDGSNAGKEALDVAIKHALTFQGKLYIIRSMTSGRKEELTEIEAAEKELEYGENLCQKQNVSCETHLLIRGMSPGEDIVAFANENGIEMIVVGVKRRSRVGKIFFGSNARYVIMEASCPVLTVK